MLGAPHALHGSWDTAAIAAYVLQRQENGERSGTGKVTEPGGLFRRSRIGTAPEASTSSAALGTSNSKLSVAIGMARMGTERSRRAGNDRHDLWGSVAEPVALLFQILRHTHPSRSSTTTGSNGSEGSGAGRVGAQRIASPSTFASRLSSLGRTRHQGAKATRQ